MHRPHETRLPLAIFFITLATFFYALMNLFTKFALPHTPLHIIVFIRFLILLICMTPFFISNGTKIFHTQKLQLHILRAIIGVLGLSVTFLSIKSIPLAMAILLSSTEPIFIPFIFRIFKGTKIIPQLYWGIITGFVGIALIMHPHSGFLQAGAFLALLGGFCRANTISIMRTLTKSDSTPTIMLYFFLFGTLLSFLMTLTSWHGFSHWSWGWLVAVGLASFFFQLFLVLTFRHAPARIMAPFNYLAVVFGVIFDWIIWGQSISWLVSVGIFLVVLGAVLTTLLGREIL